MGIVSILFNILGGLCLFLYGMKVMSDGIQQGAGDRLRRALNFMTMNRFAGVLTGFVVTGIVQSSSAVTVMIVSFVNAGLLTLTQSIGVIMGANIGTTVQFGTNGGGPISGLTDEYKDVVKYTVDVAGDAIPLYVFYAIAAAIIMWFIWNKTTLGKNMYAVGANPEAANVSGISVMQTTILVFMMGGILYGFSGFIEGARIGSNSPATGVNAELDAIAACVIGGVSFTGGTGKISGIITGVILLQIISVALQWLSVSGDIQYIIKGAIILVAVAIDMRKYLAKK